MAQMMRSLVLLSALSLHLPLGALAHMEMRWPYSFRSKFNPATSDPDYDNTFPLSPDGSNYPCKGYQDLAGSQAPVVTYTPGQTYNLTLAGTATHGGGSCQISLSYDDGKTFRVIKSMVGGCPLKLNWDFTIPSYAPPSDSVILAWTWFNLIGNREMYMQCARVGIAGQAVQRYRRTTSKRQTSIDALPNVFTCNIGKGCNTLENHEVVFPDPGNVVEFGTDAIGPSPGPGFVSNGVVPSTSAGAGAPSTTVPVTTAPVLTTTTPTTVLTTTSSPIDSTTPVTTLSTSATTTSTVTTPPYPMGNMTSGGFYTGTGYATGTGPRGTGYYNTTLLTSTKFVTVTELISTSSAPTITTQAAGGFFTITPSVPTEQTISTTSDNPRFSPTASALPQSCTPGSFTCDSLTTFSQCISTDSSSTTYIYMGTVSAGTQCVNGAIVRDNAGTCEPNGTLSCSGDQAFYRCVSGGMISMGAVAAGTVCRDGAIVAV